MQEMLRQKYKSRITTVKVCIFCKDINNYTIFSIYDKLRTRLSVCLPSVCGGCILTMLLARHWVHLPFQIATHSSLAWCSQLALAVAHGLVVVVSSLVW